MASLGDEFPKSENRPVEPGEGIFHGYRVRAIDAVRLNNLKQKLFDLRVRSHSNDN